MGDFDLLLKREGYTGSLFSVPEGGVKNSDLFLCVTAVAEENDLPLIYQRRSQSQVVCETYSSVCTARI
jgi:hypothetical protein